MISSLESLTFTVPLTAANRRLAQEISSKMPNTTTAQRVERTILAVLATQYYLQLLGFASDARANWDVWQQWTGHTAELQVPNGYLSCCAIHPGQLSPGQLIPLPEPFNASLGTVIVLLDDDYRDAKMMGFAPANVQQVSFQQLRPLDALVEQLTETPLTRLQDWLEQYTTHVWTTLGNLMSSEREPHIVMAAAELSPQERGQRRLQQMIQDLHDQTGIPPATATATTNLSQLIQQVQDDELRWRAAELLWELDPDHPASPIIRAKDLGLYLAGHSVALLVGLLPKPNQQTLVLVRLCSIGASPVLPRGIEFLGQDVDGNQFFDLVSRQQDDYIQFKFTADMGDRFTLIVRLSDAQIAENFMV